MGLPFVLNAVSLFADGHSTFRVISSVALRTHRSLRRIKDLDLPQNSSVEPNPVHSPETTQLTTLSFNLISRSLFPEREFVGTLLGFDDYVSEYQSCIQCLRNAQLTSHARARYLDMVLDDVTE